MFTERIVNYTQIARIMSCEIQQEDKSHYFINVSYILNSSFKSSIIYNPRNIFYLH